MISLDALNKLLSYNPDTGVFTWKQTRGKAKIGGNAGTVVAHGYIEIKVSGTMYKAHRLAWLMHYGVWPIGQIDHVNRIRSDNRIFNLRDVNQNNNQMNSGVRKDNTSGFKGVSYMPKYRKWRAYIRVNNKLRHLGCFETPELASKAYQDEFSKLFPHINGGVA